MKFLDLFAGIGGIRLGLESAGHECVGFCEIDKFARKSYKEIHQTEGELEYHDITEVTNEEFKKLRGKVDIIAGGFPCQSFSSAGKREGFADKTKGTLFFEIARATEQIQPQFLFLENVKGLFSHDGGRTFRTILSTLDELGYDAEWQLLNSKNFGVPQNRERVFIIGHLRNGRGREVFPIQGKNGAVNQNNIKPINDGKKIREQIGFESTNKFYDIDGIAPTLNTMGGGGREPKIGTSRGRNSRNTSDRTVGAPTEQKLEINKNGVSNTLNTVQKDNYVIESDFRIRKLTPKECWRLQGFPDWAFEKAQKVNSNSQLYKQAGNSVTVNVIKAIAEKIKVN